MIGTRLGDYEILHALKSGGMGDVLLARRRGVAGFEQLCAIKTVRAELAATEVARAMFLDEARLLARLTHPGIAQIIDFGDLGGTAYMVMEYVPGMSFRTLGERRPPPAVLCQAMAAACRGLHAAHELRDLVSGQLLGVVHRDISPDNLMLGYDARVKVLDFGIALVRGRQAPVTEFGTLKGKPPYMSPEQIKNQPIDRRSDVFSMAVVLWELATGRHLFSGDSIYAVAKAVEEQPIVAPSTIAGPLPDGLDDLVLAALARDPDARLATAAAMAEVLERIAGAATSVSLEAWAERALAGEREHHHRWLARVLGDGGGGGAAIGRPSGVATAVDLAAAATGAGRVPTGIDTRGATVLATGERTAPAGPSTRMDAVTHVDDGEAAPPRSRRGVVAALLFVAVALGGGGVWLATRGGGGAAAAGGDVDAAIAIDAAVVVSLDAAPADAAVVVPAVVDAAVPRDGGGRGRDGGGRAVDASRAPLPVDAAPASAPPVDAAPAAVTATGFLAVGEWTPAALVVVDGVAWGETPILKRKLPVGSHTVVLQDPLDRAVVHRETVEIVAGETARVRPR
ncbi:MAG: serine/threonine protein kinase [Myxococcales bacterium]|nr:serine/threonine protein kinase [Myxococcales bacterium]